MLMYLPACYPGDPSSVTQLDVVLTIHDSTANFGGFLTYAMPDSVVHVTGDSLDIGDIEDLPRDYDDLILETVEENMEDLGYVREDDPEDNGADLLLFVAAVGTESTSYWYVWDWWYYWGWYPGWGYYPGYGPGWGWYYPPGWVGSVTYEQGTLLLTLVDPDEADEEEELIGVIWGGAVRGLLGSSSIAEQRIVDGIDQAFDQSPYLGR
jgi:hypothetical protein